MSTLARVSWCGTDGKRLYGTFIKWDGDFAICRYGPSKTRIYKRNLTFEVG